MRYAIFSDIHANLRAWESVLADIRTQRIDVLICLGDVVGYGPKPMEVLDSIRSVTSNFVLGNHDAAAIGAMDYSVFNDHARQSTEWTAAALTAEAKEFLSSVPMAIEAEELLFVHAEICEPMRFEYITDIESAEANFAAGEHFVTFVGHTHYPKVFELTRRKKVIEHPDEGCVLNASSRYIVNVGSVGEPRTPDDLRARYAIYDSESRMVDLRAVHFDIRACRQDLDHTSLQIASFYLHVFEAGGTIEKDWVARMQGARVRSGQWLAPAQTTATVRLGGGGLHKQGKGIWRRRILPAAAALLVIGIPVVWLGSRPAGSGEVAASGSADLRAPEGGGFAQAWNGIKESGVSQPVEPPPEIAVVEPPVGKTSEPEKPLEVKAEVVVPESDPAKILPVEPVVIVQPVSPPDPEPMPGNSLKPGERVVSWWRMESPQDVLRDSKSRHPLDEVAPGAGFKPLGPARLPVVEADNEGGMQLGVWAEPEPSGDFALLADRSFTLEAWILSGQVKRPVFLAGTRTGEANGQQGWHIDLRPPGGAVRSGQMSFFWDSGPEITQALSGDLKVTDLEPHHIAAVWQHDFSQGMGEMRLYVDGGKVASATVPHSQISGTQANPFRIGAVENPRRLAMDEVRFSRVALDPLEFLGAAPQTMSKAGEWAENGSWTAGKPPSGEQTAVIGSGIAALSSKEVPHFKGDLVIREGASLRVSGVGVSVIPTAPAKLIFKEGSKLILGSGEKEQAIGPIVLEGKSTIYGGFSTQGHNITRVLKGEVSGDHRLALVGVNNNSFRLAAKNSFTGGFLTWTEQNQGFRVKAEAAGCFSSGFVQIGGQSTLILAVEDTIDDQAELRLLGPKDKNSKAKLILDVNETVGQLTIDKVAQEPGGWGSPGSGAKHESDLISGKGILTVLR